MANNQMTRNMPCYNGQSLSVQYDRDGTSSIETLVCAIIVDVLDVDAKLVIPTARFREDLGADSLDLVEMTIALSKVIDAKICDEEVCAITTVGEATAYIEQVLTLQARLVQEEKS